MSILEVSILLHYWASPTDVPLDNEATMIAISGFLSHGILVNAGPGNRVYKLNEAIAKPYIHAVTSVPLPVEAWKIPDYIIESY